MSIRRYDVEDAAVAALVRPPVYAPVEPDALLSLAPRRAAAAAGAQDVTLHNTRPAEFVTDANGTYPLVQLGERTAVAADDVIIHPVPAKDCRFATTRAASEALARLQVAYSWSVDVAGVGAKAYPASFTFLVLDKRAFTEVQALARL